MGRRTKKTRPFHKLCKQAMEKKPTFQSPLFAETVCCAIHRVLIIKVSQTVSYLCALLFIRFRKTALQIDDS